MKKNLILFAALIALAISGWYFINSKEKESKKSFDFSYREFALEDLEELDKIIVAKRNTDPLIFTRSGDSWMINDQFKARKNAMDNMLDVVKNIRIDYVPPNSATENIMKSFLKHGIKVELYDKAGNALKKYYIGSSPADGIGSYFVMEGSEKPLVMALPTMKGNVHTRFNYKLNEWRDMTVVDIQSDDISGIQVSYPFNKKFSFNYDGKTVWPLHDLQKPISGKVNKKMIETYLQGFEHKEAEYIENENPRRDSIVMQVPFCEISITDKAGSKKDLRFFYFTNPQFDQTQTTAMDAYSPFHTERFFIQTNWGDFYLGQHQVFKDLFWKYDLFFKE
jgi:hypothetical protein